MKFVPGDLVIAPHGVAFVRSAYNEEEHAAQKDGRVLIIGSRSTRPLASQCQPVVSLDQLPSDARCSDRTTSRSGRIGYTVECNCTRLWSGSNWVKTPCCQAGKRGVQSDDTVCCPGCGWFWKVVISGAGRTKWVSKGLGRASRRRKSRR
jgi:hypothetical protein